MEVSFLNSQEKQKMLAITEYLQGIDQQDYDNRFDKFKGGIEVIGWQEIQDWAKELANLIKGKNYVGIYGIPRGGLIIATLLSYETGLPLLMHPQERCLIVDDDAGTGLTLLPYLHRYDIALMYQNPKCKIKVTYLHKYYDEVYKVFTWNTKNDK